MEHRETEIRIEELDPAAQAAIKSWPLGYVCLDLETTALTPEKGRILLAGILEKKESDLRLHQWLAPDVSEEAALLTEVLHFLNRFCGILTWHGDRFDLPFFRSRFAKWFPGEAPPDLISQDLAKTAKGWRKFFSSGSLGLHQVARSLGSPLPQPRSGRELADVFSKYEKTKDPALSDAAWDHNRVQLLELVHVLILSGLAPLAQAKASVTRIEGQGSDLLVYGTLSFCPQAELRLSDPYGYLILSGGGFRGRLPVEAGRFYYPLPNPSAYVVLTEENTLLPKALAKTVPALRRRPATAADCRLWSEGRFVRLKEAPNPAFGLRVLIHPEKRGVWIEESSLLDAPGALSEAITRMIQGACPNQWSV